MSTSTSRAVVIKPEFQLVQANVGRVALSNGYVYPAGTVFGRLYIPAGCSVKGNLKGVILYDSKGKESFNNCYKRSRVIEFVSTPAEYARCIREYAPSNIYLNKKRTQDLIQRLLGSQVAAARAASPATPTTPATKKPAAPRVSPQQVNAARLQMRSKNMVDAWSTKPATSQPFVGIACSSDSPWNDADPAVLPATVQLDQSILDTVEELRQLIRADKHAVASIPATPAPAPSEPVEQDETERLMSVYDSLLIPSLTRKKLEVIARNYGLFASGQYKKYYRDSLIRCLVSATRQDKFSPHQVSEFIKGII